MATVKLWGRIQPKQAAQKFYRCGIGFTREWPEQPIEVDKATAERLEQEQMLEVTYTDPHLKVSETVSEGVDRAMATDSGSGASVAGMPDATNTHSKLDDNAALSQGSGIDDGGNVTGGDGDKSAVLEGKTERLGESERYAAIKKAILQLDLTDATLWTVQGFPKTESLSALTGWLVSAADRDAVQALILAEQGNQ